MNRQRARRLAICLTAPGYTPSGRLTLAERYARAQVRAKFRSRRARKPLRDNGTVVVPDRLLLPKEAIRG